MIPRVVELFSRDLDARQLAGIGENEVGMYRTPEGVLYDDPLAKNDTTLQNKNVKDYETLKWEAELRAQLAAKKGAERKLTPDQQARVQKQLEKESKVRKHVAEVELRLKNGFGFVHGLAEGPPTDAVQWLSPAVTVMLEAISAGASLLLGMQVSDTYLQCAKQTSQRLGQLRQFVGVATLRALEIAPIRPELAEEPLGGKL